MSKRIKHLLSFFLILGLFIHFLLIGIYTSPYSIGLKKINFVSDYYVYPYFHQYWGVFAPTPKKIFNLYVRQNQQKHWQEWRAVFQEKLNLHKTNVAKGNEVDVLLYSNAINYLYYSLDTNKHVYNEKPSNINFDVLNHALRQELFTKNRQYLPYEVILTVSELDRTQAFYFKQLN